MSGGTAGNGFLTGNETTHAMHTMLHENFAGTRMHLHSILNQGLGCYFHQSYLQNVVAFKVKGSFQMSTFYWKFSILFIKMGMIYLGFAQILGKFSTTEAQRHGEEKEDFTRRHGEHGEEKKKENRTETRKL